MSQNEFNFEDLTSARPLSVWELTAQIKDLVEAAFPRVWVTGEISNLSRPQSGHCYLTLKDDRAQLKAAMWRPVASRVRFEMHDGLEVICRGRLEVYAPRGNYQLIIEEIEPKGMGALELAFRQLREKLGREGLFDPARKRPLPSFVRQIAVVTSPTGAAIRDFLQVLGRRWRGRMCSSPRSACRAKGPPRKSPPQSKCLTNSPGPSIAWWSPAAAEAWKTFGPLTRKL